MIYLDLRVALCPVEIFFNESIGGLVAHSALELLVLPGPHAIPRVGVATASPLRAVRIGGVIRNNYWGFLRWLPLLGFNGPIILVYLVRDRLLHHHAKHEGHAETSHEFEAILDPPYKAFLR